MADRRLLTDRFLRALPPARHGQRDEVWDARLPGFGVRITGAKDADPARRGKAGKITFMLRARFKPGTDPTRRTIGIYPTTTLEDGGVRRSPRASTPPSLRPRPVRGPTVSGHCGSGIHSASPPRRSSPTS